MESGWEEPGWPEEEEELSASAPEPVTFDPQDLYEGSPWHNDHDWFTSQDADSSWVQGVSWEGDFDIWASDDHWDEGTWTGEAWPDSPWESPQ